MKGGYCLFFLGEFLKNLFSKQCSGSHCLFLITRNVAPVSAPVFSCIHLGDTQGLQRGWNDRPNGMGTAARISSDKSDVPGFWLLLRQASRSFLQLENLHG